MFPLLFRSFPGLLQQIFWMLLVVRVMKSVLPPDESRHFCVRPSSCISLDEHTTTMTLMRTPEPSSVMPGHGHHHLSLLWAYIKVVCLGILLTLLKFHFTYFYTVYLLDLECRRATPRMAQAFPPSVGGRYWINTMLYSQIGWRREKRYAVHTDARCTTWL